MFRVPLARCLLTAALVLAATACPSSAAQSDANAGRPNVVLILADDVSADMFTCYGRPGAARTPNIDRIARRGVMFRTCWAPAICAPSRALLMTGKYSSTTGVYHNGVWLGDSRGSLFTRQHSWAKLLRESGYATAIAGKWHCGAKMPWEPEVGFHEHCLWEGPEKIRAHTGVDIYQAGLRQRTEQTDNRYWHPSVIENHKYVPVKRSDFGPDLRCRFLLDFMGRMARERKPFVAYWPIVIPHGPYSTTPLAGEVMDIQPKKPDLTGLGPQQRQQAIGQHQRYMRQRFVNLIEYMDLLVGKLWDRAEQLGIAESTYFIFCGDNGTAVTAKGRGVERGCHVPYVNCGPGVKRRGPTDALTDFADIAPTLLEIAGVGTPPGYRFDGRSQLPFLRGETEDHRAWIYSYVGASQLLRQRTHLLEAVNPLFDSPQGRFYFTGEHRFGHNYRLLGNSGEHASDRARLDGILAKFPPLDADHPHWQTRKGKAWLKENSTPEAIRRHLHNHKDYQFYDEDSAAD